MSTLGRVFTVVVLIASLVYLGITATLYANRIEYKKLLDKERKSTTEDVDAKQRVEKQRDEESKVKDSQITTMSGAATTAITNAKTAEDKAKGEKERSDKADGKLSSLRTQYETISGQISDKDKQIADLTTQLDSARKDRDTAVAAKDQDEQKLLDTQTRLTNTEKELVDLEKTYIQKVKDLEEAKGKISLVPPEMLPAEGAAVKRPVDGKILAVSKVMNLLIVSVGKDRGVAVGDQFMVYRGDKFVGKIQVEKADKDWSSAKMIDDYKRLDPSVGDDVSSRNN